VERQSHLPEILYRYGKPEAAYAQLNYLASGPRKEYPEASFCTIGAIAEGLMGIGLEYHPPAESITDGGYVECVITTRSRLTEDTDAATLARIPIRGNIVTLTHEGRFKSSLENNAGPSVIWRSYLPGMHTILHVNGESTPATQGVSEYDGEPFSSVSVILGAGQSKTVSV
jgi:hypothetical protein